VNRSLIILGGEHPTAVGQSLLHAALCSTNTTASYLNADEATAGSRLWRALLWRVAQKRPARLNAFNRKVLNTCTSSNPSTVLCAGNLPLLKRTVEALKNHGHKIGLYSTDDPWNPAHKAQRFLNALPSYEQVFTTRRANIEDMQRLGVSRVSHLPFGYDERYFYPWRPDDDESSKRCDVFFAGGADEDRLPLVQSIMSAGHALDLYGGVWERWPEVRAAYRGYAAPRDLSKMIAGAAVCLCLVRRANRDGTSMRTFELPAAMACMLVEDTPEHRELFGIDGDAVKFFAGPGDLDQHLTGLLRDPARRAFMAARAHALVTQGQHRYADRLEAMIASLSRPQQRL
jgi:spore maturation protein CgeB